jgi:hypothetical protein
MNTSSNNMSEMVDHDAANEPTKLGLLSFDLDDTLFSTSQTVRDANAAQIAYMNNVCSSSSNDNRNAAEIPFTVDNFLQIPRTIRRALTGPVTYTELRKMAIPCVEHEIAKVLPHAFGNRCCLASPT